MILIKLEYTQAYFNPDLYSALPIIELMGFSLYNLHSFTRLKHLLALLSETCINSENLSILSFPPSSNQNSKY